MKRALITGGSGFLGRYLQECLCAQDFEVSAARRATIGEIAEPACWKKLLEETRPDVIYHLLGVIDAADDVAFEAAHLAPTRALLQASFGLGLEKTPIFILGSAAEYGDVSVERQPIGEAEPAHPVSAYGRSKLRATECALEFAARGLQVVITRLFNVFDRAMSTRMMPGMLLAQLETKTRQIHLGPPDRVRDFLAADVAMRALAGLAATEIPRGTIVNLCSGQGLSLREISMTMLRAAGRDVSDLVFDDEDSARSGGIQQSVGNPRLITKLLGYRPTPPSLADFAQLVTTR